MNDTIATYDITDKTDFDDSRYTVELICHVESTPPDEHFPDGYKKEDLQWMEDEYYSGNHWVWFNAEVRVKLNDTQLTGSDYLGCCSYTDKEDFLQSDYFDDMVRIAKQNLTDEIERIKSKTSSVEGEYRP